MIELIDLKVTRFDSADLADLQSLLRQLIGQPFRSFRVAYGDELRVHLGELSDHAVLRGRPRARTSYAIGARASSWIVNSAPKATLAVSDDLDVRPIGGGEPGERVDIKAIEAPGFITPGASVRFARPERSTNGFSLQLGFSDGSTLMIWAAPEFQEIIPEAGTEPDDAGGMEVSDWEVFTPHERVLRVGPGPRWSYLESTARRRADWPPPPSRVHKARSPIAPGLTPPRGRGTGSRRA